MEEERRLEPGTTSSVTQDVTEEMTAERLGSGDVPVLGTPALVALVERAAVEAVRLALPPGATTVGVRVEVDHSAPTPVGARITVEARIEEVADRRISFSFEARDETGVVATGSHVRVRVQRDAFVSRARERRS